jgi:hypothetical protein
MTIVITKTDVIVALIVLGIAVFAFWWFHGFGLIFRDR